MPEYLTPTDIGNRGLQHVGDERIASFTESSKAAREVSFAYGKLRRAELENNVWTFATRRAALRAIDTTTMLLSPSLWVETVTYFAGSIVQDGSGTPWRSRIQNNLGASPQESPSAWEPYFGPLTVSVYDSTTDYFAGELVYVAVGNGTYRVYVSLISANSDNPATATAWDATVVYNKAQVVTYLSVAYMSLIDLSLNQIPSASAANWAVGTTYALNALVNGSDNATYKSLNGSNVGVDPTTDGGVHWLNTGLTPWTSVFSAGSGSINWLEIGGAEFASGVGLTTMNTGYPLGAGPLSQDNTRNVYRLPANYVRKAPQDPKAGSASLLGAPTNSIYDDWNYEGNFIVSSNSDMIILRFVADVQDVTQMKTMFCEGLACRIALEVCEPLTQSTAKHAAIKQSYDDVMGKAKTSNAIEAGSEEAPLDDWLACRA